MRSHLYDILRQRKQASLYRTRLTHTGPQSPILHIDGKKYLAFCSNDYLGLANHSKISDAMHRGIERYAAGAGASHLINGHSLAHHELENALAEFTGRERALLFSTGYMANLGVVSALLDRHDAIFLDKLDHASLIDAALLSRARLHRYPHGDMQALERMLCSSPARFKLIISDGVFSMDGDLAKLPELVELSRTCDAWLMIDDAHGLGVLGKTGRGTLEHFNLSVRDVPILMGTLGKAFGVFGAFIAGEEILIETLIQSARSYIYTTALPPAVAEAARAGLEVAEQESWRREHLWRLVAHFRQGAAARGISLSASNTPIQPVPLGSAEKALSVSEALYKRGILVTAIRPPTIPQGTARLRVTLSASHEIAQVDHLLEQL
ncbi:MAG: 8-amino-7-oxononanoate synthase [Gammaproteobacteria bacterium]|nr:8-amino-7-oxononanoate synthase [Gammaproteobacteria bacterium]